jgi:hypothetical protein
MTASCLREAAGRGGGVRRGDAARVELVLTVKGAACATTPRQRREPAAANRGRVPVPASAIVGAVAWWPPLVVALVSAWESSSGSAAFE